jgi:hypothetical protein
MENIVNKAFTDTKNMELNIPMDYVKLPSKGFFYANGTPTEIPFEYMTTRDEEVLTNEAYFEKGMTFDVLMKRKIKAPEINIDSLLPGDIDAVLLALRTTAYGYEYLAEVIDPSTKKPFKTTIDLSKLKYKEISPEIGDDLLFKVELPIRKDVVKCKVLNYGEEKKISELSKRYIDENPTQPSPFLSNKIKASIVEINGKKPDNSYLSKYVDTMLARDSSTIRKAITDIEPGVDTNITIESPNGKFITVNVSFGLDFFFQQS